jgi:secreted PhoX family phosphatase
VQPNRGDRTVIFSLEDGPATLDNQLYMYVGKKDRSATASVLARNGLDNGKLFLFRSLDPGRNSERTFTSGSVTGEWVEIPKAENLTDAELEATSDAAGATTFVRPEDGAYNANNRNEFFFVTTGSSSAADEGVNELGRLYSLALHPGNRTSESQASTPKRWDVSMMPLVSQTPGRRQRRRVRAGRAGRHGSPWKAHSPTTPPAPNTVEDGQLFLMRPAG